MSGEKFYSFDIDKRAMVLPNVLYVLLYVIVFLLLYFVNDSGFLYEKGYVASGVVIALIVLVGSVLLIRLVKTSFLVYNLFGTDKVFLSLDLKEKGNPRFVGGTTKGSLISFHPKLKTQRKAPDAKIFTLGFSLKEGYFAPEIEFKLSVPVKVLSLVSTHTVTTCSYKIKAVNLEDLKETLKGYGVPV